MPKPLTDTTDLRSDLVVIQNKTVAAHPSGIEGDCINSIRFLSIDAVEKANSGHPGTPMALAPLTYRLYTRFLKHDPKDPAWPDRDRFVLSNGHASMLLYSTLHLCGYDLSLEDLKNFRQYGSKTPGHPEYGVTPGVEVTTGPLGQGLTNAVGMAMAEKMLAARFNRPNFPIVDHRTWAVCGDGDLMEGISEEAASLAGQFELGKLTLFYDDNHIDLEGATSVDFRENVIGRFQAYDWHIAYVHDVNDLQAMDKAINEAIKEKSRPSLIVVHSHIGYGSPIQDTAKAHGSPLGTENVEATRKKLNWQYAPFEIPKTVYDHFQKSIEDRSAFRNTWQKLFEEYKTSEPELAAEFERVLSGKLNDGWEKAMPVFEPGSEIATRKSAGEALNAFAAVVPELVGGSADVTPSTDTQIKSSGDINCSDWKGSNIHFGVREHAMGAICNGIAVHGGFRPYCATFFSFSDYMREPIRLSALMQIPVIFIYTHDSIGLGEDGPTHQPIEQLASLRAMPGLRVIRPADANESAQAWREAIAHKGPTVLIFSRQALPILDSKVLDVSKGATVISDGDQACIVSTGSEVEVALKAKELLSQKGVQARVVSLPSFEIFRSQPENYKESILPSKMPTVSVEAASPFGWCEFADASVGLTRFGASAPATIVYKELGITPEAVASKVLKLLSKEG